MNPDGARVMTTPEVAALLGVKPATVRSTARNARNRGLELRWLGARPLWADGRTALWDRSAVLALHAARVGRRGRVASKAVGLDE